MVNRGPSPNTTFTFPLSLRPLIFLVKTAECALLNALSMFLGDCRPKKRLKYGVEMWCSSIFHECLRFVWIFANTWNSARLGNVFWEPFGSNMDCWKSMWNAA